MDDGEVIPAESPEGGAVVDGPLVEVVECLLIYYQMMFNRCMLFDMRLKGLQGV